MDESKHLTISHAEVNTFYDEILKLREQIVEKDKQIEIYKYLLRNVEVRAKEDGDG